MPHVGTVPHAHHAHYLAKVHECHEHKLARWLVVRLHIQQVCNPNCRKHSDNAHKAACREYAHNGRGQRGDSTQVDARTQAHMMVKTICISRIFLLKRAISPSAWPCVG